jgi:hypothetical protein
VLIDELSGDPAALLVVQNDNAADGRDPSWLWDVPFEQLAPRRAIASGTRCLDVAVRLRAAGFDVVGVEPDPFEALQRHDVPEGLFVAASYSAYHEIVRRSAAR